MTKLQTIKKHPARTISPKGAVSDATTGLIFMKDPHGTTSQPWMKFEHPTEIVETHTLEEVVPCLRRVESATAQDLYAAGFISYEAAPAFDPAYRTGPPSALPLLWFGFYEKSSPCDIHSFATGLNDPISEEDVPLLSWKSDTTLAEYHDHIQRIKNYIARGDTYQVNYTFRRLAYDHKDPLTLFKFLCRAQDSDYQAYIDIGSHAVCSASPELFFSLNGNEIQCRPMKGTAARGLTWAGDEQQARLLKQSEKNRAENIMIVDMIRNDLGRIADYDSIHVKDLFNLQRYETLWQMTSTITARTQADIADIFKALFPCASVTGAPKIRTMEIIAELENRPRGIYTGCMGYVAPGRQARFNVAIRTVTVERPGGAAVYGTGSGVVWESDARDEYRECSTKSLLLTKRPPPFRLLETMLWRPHEGYFLLDLHLERLHRSAHYFDFSIDLKEIKSRLLKAGRLSAENPRMIRLLVKKDGSVDIETYPVAHPSAHRRSRIVLSDRAIDSSDPFFYHKTTHRACYDHVVAAFPECDDVILWNEKDEITESCKGNVVVSRAGRLITPPITCGLLGGTYREYLIQRGRIEEGVILKDEIKEAEKVYLINSVRGWIPVEFAAWASHSGPSDF